MIKTILRIYDYMRSHSKLCVLSFCITTALLTGLVSKIQFNEDISAFLPLGEQYQESLQVYQDVSGASKLLAVFAPKKDFDADADALCEAMTDFEAFLSEIDTSAIVKEVTTQIDIEKVAEITDFVYNNIPFFLTESDYERMDSLLGISDYTENQLQEALSLLMFPTSGLLSSNLEKDPLNLFTPAVSRLRRDESNENFELYDGYIFTKDMKQSIVMLTSPYGNSETHGNSSLMQMLNTVRDSVETRHAAISLHYTGGPAIAVSNSNQIKQDSIMSVIIAVILIFALLFYAFRSVRNILLIVLSISWGGLFALGLLSVFRESVSLIVIGISSIIVGIAVNYPLHLIAHTSHTHDVRQTLKEIISPLVIGNITTVGAFCALIPLQATALRDLGIFSALLLIGTILFVVLWLPHIVKVNTNVKSEGEKSGILDWFSNLSFEKSKWTVSLIAILTLVFGWFSLRTEFDADMNHINYLTDEQRADMEYLQKMTSGTENGQQSIYVVSKGASINDELNASQKMQEPLKSIARKYESASVSPCPDFLCSKEEQRRRIAKWEDFVTRHAPLLGPQLREKTVKAGFSSKAFLPFDEIVNRRYEVQDVKHFYPLQSVFSSHLSTDSLTGTYRVVDVVIARSEDTEAIEKELNSILPKGAFCFDIGSLNGALAHNLTDNFNYVGWACALIVFLFLWFSFGSIKLAILSFMPMAVSWIWILGIMGMLGIHFNIVNIILATFIFGQGDDYTIFMTEGCLYEHRYGKKMLASHKRSIALSALIMFIGIGSLIFAKHPALRSLAEVTIVGMFSVVLMAYVIPPFLFKKLRMKSEE